MITLHARFSGSSNLNPAYGLMNLSFYRSARMYHRPIRASRRAPSRSVRICSRSRSGRRLALSRSARKGIRSICVRISYTQAPSRLIPSFHAFLIFLCSYITIACIRVQRIRANIQPYEAARSLVHIHSKKALEQACAYSAV